MYIGMSYCSPKVRLDKFNGLQVRVKTNGHRVKVVMHMASTLQFDHLSYAVIDGGVPGWATYELPFANFLVDNIDKEQPTLPLRPYLEYFRLHELRF